MLDEARAQLADVRLESGPVQIARSERQRAITIQVTPAETVALQEAMERIGLSCPRSGYASSFEEARVIVEEGTTDQILHRPVKDYTKALVNVRHVEGAKEHHEPGLPVLEARGVTAGKNNAAIVEFSRTVTGPRVIQIRTPRKGA